MACSLLNVGRRRIGLFGLVALSAAAVWSPDAQACSPDPCEYSENWEALAPAFEFVGTSGSIPLRATRNSWTSDAVLAAADYVTVTVFDSSGVAVFGDLTYDEDFRLLEWQAGAGLVEGETYSVHVVVDNAGITEALGKPGFECAEDIDAVSDVTAGAVSPVTDATAQLNAEVNLQANSTLDTVVCCDGAMPEDQIGSCIQEVYWGEGHCEVSGGTGWLDVVVTLPIGQLPKQYAARFISGDSTSVPPTGETSVNLRRSEPVCGHYEVLDLSTGDIVIGEEACIGEDLVRQLGAQPIDPAPGLDAQCEGAPYVCEHDGSAWNPDNCVDWSDADDDGADADDGGTDGGDADGGDADGGDADGGDADGGDADGGGTDADGGSDGGADGADDGVDRGCACAAGPTDVPTGGLLFAIFLGLRLRRRRQS